MTRDEILAMPAGPELDALVAELVMGWTKGPMDWMMREPWVRPDGCHVFPWHPSTEIAAAWEVFEKMLSLGHDVKIYAISGYMIQAEVLMDEGESLARGLFGRGNAAPLAICKSALLAVMGDK